MITQRIGTGTGDLCVASALGRPRTGGMDFCLETKICQVIAVTRKVLTILYRGQLAIDHRRVQVGTETMRFTGPFGDRVRNLRPGERIANAFVITHDWIVRRMDSTYRAAAGAPPTTSVER